MGEELPPDPPELDPTKEYQVNWDSYLRDPDEACDDDTFVEHAECGCWPGGYIQNYYDNGGDCTIGNEFWWLGGDINCSVVNSISPPWDSFEECFEDCQRKK